MAATCDVCLIESGSLQIVSNLCYQDATIQHFHLRLWMRICGNCESNFDEFDASQRPRLTCREIWRLFYQWQEEQEWIEFAPIFWEFEELIEDFFEDDKYSSWREGWRPFAEEFLGIMENLIDEDPEEWD